MDVRLTCPACGAPQPFDQDVDRFALLGMPRRLSVAHDDLEGRYLEASRAVHPDRHQTADDRTRALSLTASAAVNQAYRTLSDPVERALLARAARESLGRDTPGPPGLAEIVSRAEASRVSGLVAPARCGWRRPCRLDTRLQFVFASSRSGSWCGMRPIRKPRQWQSGLKRRLSEIATWHPRRESRREGVWMARVVGIVWVRRTVWCRPEGAYSAVSQPRDGRGAAPSSRVVPGHESSSASARTGSRDPRGCCGQRSWGSGTSSDDEERRRYRFAEPEDGGESCGSSKDGREVRRRRSPRILRELSAGGSGARRAGRAGRGEQSPAYFNEIQSSDARRRKARRPRRARLGRAHGGVDAYGSIEATKDRRPVYDLGGGRRHPISAARWGLEVLATNGDTVSVGDLDLRGGGSPRRLAERMSARILSRAQVYSSTSRPSYAQRSRPDGDLLGLPNGRESPAAADAPAFERWEGHVERRVALPEALKTGHERRGMKIVAVGGSTRFAVRRQIEAVFVASPSGHEPDRSCALGHSAGILTGPEGHAVLESGRSRSASDHGGVSSGSSIAHHDSRGREGPFTTAADNKPTSRALLRASASSRRQRQQHAARSPSIRRRRVPAPRGQFLVDANASFGHGDRHSDGTRAHGRGQASYGSRRRLERMLEESSTGRGRCEKHGERSQRRCRTIIHSPIQLVKHAAQLAAAERERIEAAMSTLEHAAAGEDAVAIRDAYDALSETSEPFARRIMDEALQETVGGRALEDL